MTDDWREGSERLAPFLSARGRKIRMPEGIRVWGERAARAGGIDATMGVIRGPGALFDAAGDAETIAYLPGVREAFAAWTPNEVFPYAPVAGVGVFRERWRAWMAGKRTGGTGEEGADPGSLTLPVATAGVTGALCAVGLLVTGPDDPVLVPDRRWDGYDTTLGAVCGARLEPVRLLERGAWAIEAWAGAMRKAARRQGRVVCVINFPHNPTGYVPTAREVEAFAETAVEVAETTGAAVVILCDDAYEGYVYTDRPRSSPFHRLVDRHPRVLPIKCDGITKELLFWGGRLGAATTAFPESWGSGGRGSAETVWENKMSAVVRGTISSASTSVQVLVARLLSEPGALVEARRPVLDLLAERRDALVAALGTSAARAAFEPDPFHGGLFALLNLRRGDAVATAERLLTERRIGVVPFRDDSIGLNALRVTYATVPTDRIAEVVAAAASIV
ncbi:MAG: aminotransferase class I/II-fold pyridoxal phosphate-dependent enzyme [Gemmatimonadetes bacterium]|nr:aminotransferase class I/II-fold pyridoxal phosphate-dependent enzyme [Gemmatimonadota bacterium]